MSQQPKKHTVLLIDDEEDILFSLKMLLKKEVAHVYSESNPYHIPRLLRQYQPDLVILDLNYRKGATTGEDGLMWLGKIKDLRPQTQVIILTSYSKVSVAVQALKYGATDFVEKPWQNDKLLETVKGVLNAKSKNSTETSNILTSSINDENLIIGTSPLIKETLRTIEKVAKTDANILILGENGTGKEMVAKAIHKASLRQGQTFVKVDVGAIPDTLIESEFFGHKKGAFTDAHENRVGKFEAAQNGTLFLDEIGNLSQPSQSKFLSVLQNMVITPLGTNDTRQVNFRLICATNESMDAMVSARAFRQDLYYRINTIEIHVPALRERASDIPLLVEHFLEIFRTKYQKPTLAISANALEQLSRYAWPGNVRELRHALERAVIMADDSTLQVSDFRLAHAPIPSTSEELTDLNINEMEQKLISKAMQVHKGNISKAAEELGLTRAALYRRLDKYKLS